MSRELHNQLGRGLLCRFRYKIKGSSDKHNFKTNHVRRACIKKIMFRRCSFGVTPFFESHIFVVAGYQDKYSGTYGFSSVYW